MTGKGAGMTGKGAGMTGKGAGMTGKGAGMTGKGAGMTGKGAAGVAGWGGGQARRRCALRFCRPGCGIRRPGLDLGPKPNVVRGARVPSCPRTASGGTPGPGLAHGRRMGPRSSLGRRIPSLGRRIPSLGRRTLGAGFGGCVHTSRSATGARQVVRGCSGAVAYLVGECCVVRFVRACSGCSGWRWAFAGPLFCCGGATVSRRGVARGDGKGAGMGGRAREVASEAARADSRSGAGMTRGEVREWRGERRGSDEGRGAGVTREEARE